MLTDKKIKTLKNARLPLEHKCTEMPKGCKGMTRSWRLKMIMMYRTKVEDPTCFERKCK